MAIFKAYHYYKNKNPKKNLNINELLPIRDIEVSQRVYDQFRDCTGREEYRIEERVELRNVLADMLETTGAPA